MPLLMVIRRDIMVMRLTMVMALIIGHTATTATRLIIIPITDAGLDTVVGAVGITGAAEVMEAVVIGEVVIVVGMAGKSGSLG